ncbi:tRNA(Ile)-lysidine synthetase [Mucilaginibacter sp. PAMC 26640]|nr:tRNA(Ile)-lysidine synthetase [Mucilaginibacter sp. PAMC 26640]
MLPVKQFIDFVEQNTLFGTTTKLLAAVSGGMDSVLMAHLLGSAGYHFGITHCNFMLRGDDANADQEFTRQLAQQLGVSFHTVNFDTRLYATENKISIQMAARDLRYQWFQQLCQTAGYEAVALAHHQNDTIETILLNLTRGTGIAGLHGILPKNGTLVRPLLFLTRGEIEDVVRNEQLAYVEDSSNASTKYARNKIRHQVIPLLKALNPNIEQTFENNLRNFRELEQLLNDTIAELKHKMLVQHGEDIHISIPSIHQLSPKRLLLFKLLQPFGFVDNVVDDLLTALDKHSGRIFESAGHLLLVDRGELILTKKKVVSNDNRLVNESDQQVTYGQYRLTVLPNHQSLIIKDNPLAVSVPSVKLIYPLMLRAWQQGDTFKPLGMNTRQKLSDFFIHQKVPLHLKQLVPILVNGNGEIIWIGGYRPDERYKVDNNTEKVTIFELIKL